MYPALSKLREQMKQTNAAAVYLPTRDPHGSEYPCAHFAARAHFSGFTGSAGTLVVLADRAALWTDARYFLQAEAQLQGSGITLMRQGEAGTPSPAQYLLQQRLAGERVLADGRCLSAREGTKLVQTLQAGGLQLRCDTDPVALCWPTRPALPCAPIWALDEHLAGQTRAEKLIWLRGCLAAQGADTLLLSTLDEIAWLLNLRGGDIPFTPLFLAHLALDAQEVRLYVAQKALSPALRAALAADGVTPLPYENFAPRETALAHGKRVQLDPQCESLHLQQLLQKNGAQLLARSSPIALQKAQKNPAEIAGMREAHRREGLALVQLLYELDCARLAGTLSAWSELSLAARLEELRAAVGGYRGPSFAPIVAYGANGAIVHYSATEESNVSLAPAGFLLLDLGAHFETGTTDLSRSLPLGEPTALQKQHYTAVLRGHLNLAAAVFPQGSTGRGLDYAARAPLWQLLLDYGHGTGHGVGHLLCVHEGPQRIHHRASESAPLQVGMITSNEPGLYLEGQYGIRLENLLLCVPKAKSDFGDFLAFETLSLVPYAPRAIALEQLSTQERAQLNAYHAKVYEALAPDLPKGTRVWLFEQCRAL